MERSLITIKVGNTGKFLEVMDIFNYWTGTLISSGGALPGAHLLCKISKKQIKAKLIGFSLLLAAESVFIEIVMPYILIQPYNFTPGFK